MDLEEFVAQSLSNLINGVRRAQTECGSTGGKVNPVMRRVFTGATGGGVVLGWSSGDSGVPVLLVEFDVAVTVNEGTGKKGGVGVHAGIISAGGAAHRNRAETAASRIKFSIPVLLPPGSKGD
jgi:hypothetical protein